MHGLTEAIAMMNAWLLATFAILSALDLYTTSQFPRYGIIEANDRLRRLVSLHGFDELYFVKWVVFLGVFALTGEGLFTPVTLAVGCVAQGLIVLWNGYQIARRAFSLKEAP
jgi:hypothetical protein